MNQRFTTRPEIRGTFGAVASTHWIGTAVGMGILERGGNAFDAAVATGFALQIVEPHLNGPGGDAPIILQQAGGDAPVVICGQGVAPQAATIEAYRERGVTLVPGTGLLAAVVPGAFDAWMLLLRDYGTMTLREVLEPAIGYAVNGFPAGLPRRRRNSRHCGPLQGGLAEFGGGLAAGRRRAAPQPAHRDAVDRQELRAYCGGSGGRRRRPGRPDRGGAHMLLRGLRRGSH